MTRGGVKASQGVSPAAAAAAGAHGDYHLHPALTEAVFPSPVLVLVVLPGRSLLLPFPLLYQALCVVHGSLLDAPPVHIHSQNAKGKQEADKPQPAMASIEMPLVPGPSAKSLEASGHQCGGTHSGNGGSHETWQPHAPNAAATITADSSLTPFVAAGEAGGVGNRRGVLSPSPSSSNVGRRTAVMPGVVA